MSVQLEESRLFMSVFLFVLHKCKVCDQLYSVMSHDPFRPRITEHTYITVFQQFVHQTTNTSYLTVNPEIGTGLGRGDVCTYVQVCVRGWQQAL